jgi:tetratricopeptide (TPR) repeat protein
VHYNRGTVLSELGRHQEALGSYDRALELCSDYPRALYNRGDALKELERFDEALASYDRALVFLPENVDLLNNRANVLADRGRHGEALSSYEKILTLQPNNAEALNNCGNALAELKRYDEALARYEKALALRPKDAGTHYNRGTVLAELGRHEEALESYERALDLQPDYPSALYNRGDALLTLNRPAEAIVQLEKALAIDPRLVAAYVAYGNALQALGRHEEALQKHDLALSIQPGFVPAEWSKSLLYLGLGKFSEGWKLYDRRWISNKMRPRPYPGPRWNGERVSGVLLVWAEQGLGDQILYASMLRELVSYADSVVFEVEPRLAPLFRRSFPAVKIVELGPELYAGRIDAQISLGEVGRFLRRDWAAFPRSEHGYLRADPALSARLRERLGGRKQRVVGLSWKSVNPSIGQSKSAPLRDFAKILRLPEVRSVDLQYGDTFEERAAIEQEFGVQVLHIDEVDNRNDIDALAALITACDAVVTVSNTTAHLAGALGKPTWVLVPYGFRRIWYWFSDRADSPWYPHMQVRRQAALQPWSELIASMSDEVARFLQSA